MKVVFKATAKKDLAKLNPALRKRIGEKLRYFVDQPDPIKFAVPLVGQGIAGQYRFRIGDYRLLFDVDENTITVLSVEHRRQVYKR